MTVGFNTAAANIGGFTAVGVDKARRTGLGVTSGAGARRIHPSARHGRAPGAVDALRIHPAGACSVDALRLSAALIRPTGSVFYVGVSPYVRVRPRLPPRFTRTRRTSNAELAWIAATQDPPAP
jgi:hypothetical protein